MEAPKQQFVTHIVSIAGCGISRADVAKQRSGSKTTFMDAVFVRASFTLT